MLVEGAALELVLGGGAELDDGAEALLPLEQPATIVTAATATDN
ncbi:hypothetical protein [Mycobacterium sp. IS-2888]|nr:hypothetical protein [Mycobacterium sp. IS-2888]